MAVVFSMLVATACQSGEGVNTGSAPAPAATAAPAPPPPAIPPSTVAFSAPPAPYRGELPPLPVTPYVLPRPPELIKAVYAFAARHPEVLHYVPCFCGCERSGHSSNDSCFIQGREQNGRPKWDAHGMT